MIDPKTHEIANPADFRQVFRRVVEAADAPDEAERLEAMVADIFTAEATETIGEFRARHGIDKGEPT